MHFHLNRHTNFILTFFSVFNNPLNYSPPQKKMDKWMSFIYYRWFWISYYWYAGHTHHTVHHVIKMNYLCTVHFVCHSNCNLSLFGLFLGYTSPLWKIFTGIGEIPRNATETASGFWGQLRDTAVIIPRVPSDPMKSCLRS